MESTQKSATGFSTRERTWAPRMWIGSDFFGWLRIMAKGHFRFSLPHAYIGVCTSLLSFGHTVLKNVQNALYRPRIQNTKIERAPIFIIGHWRTGTTLLHEMMILDGRHNFPNFYQCYEPNHFLLTERLVKEWLGFLLPTHRPMDNMPIGWDRPQEDEFAMCMLGQPSPYLDIVFPNRPSLAPGSLDLEGLTPSQRRNWKRAFFRFVQTLTFKDPRRLVMKSPPHSCRIPTLLEMFPDARFVHIVRNPYHVFPSTVKLWKSLAEKHGMQTPHHRGIEDRVLETLPHLYEKLEAGKKLVAPSRFHELRYEDLIRNPIGEMQTLYERLELDGFADLQPQLTDYLCRNANYEKNKFHLSDSQRDEVTKRWGNVIRRYGYPIESGEEISASLSPDQRPSPHREPDIVRSPAVEPKTTGDVPIRTRAA